MSDSLRGQFLIAGYRLRDSNFFKTAVLIVEHNAQGAMGVIVNRPSDETVTETLAGHFDLPETGDVVYQGGPVEPAALFIVHDGGIDQPDEPEIVPGIFVASSAETFERIVRGAAEEPLAAAAKGNPVLGLPPDHPTLPSLLRGAGYATALIGKWHLGYRPHFGPEKSGYDYFFGPMAGGVDYFSHCVRNGDHDLWENEIRVRREGYLTDLL